MKVKTTYYLNDEQTWVLEKDGDDYWIRTEKGYQMVRRDLLEALYTALGLMLGKERSDG